MSFIENMMGGLGTGIAAKMVASKKEIPIRGKPAGKLQEQYYRGLYGNKLNPWEWQGNQGEGGVAPAISTSIGQRNLERTKMPKEAAIQGAQMSTQRDVATIHAKAQTDSAKIAAGFKPGGKDDQEPKLSTTQSLKNVKTQSDFHLNNAKMRAISISNDKQRQEIQNLKQDRLFKIQETIKEGMQAKWSEEKILSQIIQNAGTTIGVAGILFKTFRQVLMKQFSKFKNKGKIGFNKNRRKGDTMTGAQRNEYIKEFGN